MIVHDAAVAFVALITAAVAWVQVLAGFAAMVLCAVPLCIAPSVKAFRARRGPQEGRGAPHGPSRGTRVAEHAPKPPQRRSGRPVPSWAHTEPHDYEIKEAA